MRLSWSRVASCTVASLLLFSASTIPASAQNEREPSVEVGLNRDILGVAEDVQGEGPDLGRVGRYRVYVRWDEVEPSPGQYLWSRVDEALALHRRDRARGDEGPDLLVTVHASPEWARSAPETLPSGIPVCEEEAVLGPSKARFAPPDHPEDLALFIVRLAKRFPDIDAVEVWREPNILPNWHANGPDAEAYARMLDVVAQELGASLPELGVISAAPAPVVVEALPWCYMADTAFLRRLAATGVLDRVDAIGIQARGFDQVVSDPPDENRLNLRRAELLQSLVSRAGVDRPLWALAFGWPSVLSERAAFGSAEQIPFTGAEGERYRNVREAAAFDNLEAFAYAKAYWPWLERAYLLDPGADAFNDDVAAHTLARIQDEALPAPPRLPVEEPSRDERRMSLLVGLGAALLLALWLLGLPAIREPLWSVLSPLRRLPLAKTLFLALLLLLANVSAPMPMGVAALLGLALLGTAQLEAIVFLVAACLPFFYAFNMRVGPRPVQTVELLILLGVLAALVSARLEDSKSGRGPSFRRPFESPSDRSAVQVLDLAVLGLLAWSLCSPLWAERPERALFEWRTVMFEPILFYGLLRSAASPLRMARTAIFGAILGGLAAAALGLAGSLLPLLGLSLDWAGGVAAEGVIRARGPYGSPNNLALALGRVLPILLVFAWLDDAKADRRIRSAARLALPFLTVAMVATFSRGAALLGLPAMLAFAYGLSRTDRMALSQGLWQREPSAPPDARDLAALRDERGVQGFGNGKDDGEDREEGDEAGEVRGVSGFGYGFGSAGRPAVIILTLGLVAAGLLALGRDTERLRGAFDLSSPGGTGYIRLRLWESSVDMIRDQPLLGLGLDNFHYAYRDRYVQRSVLQERSLSHPHNLVLDWWTRLGLPGLLSLFVLTTMPVVLALRLLRRRDVDADRWALAAAALGMMVYALAHGLIDNHFFLVDLAGYAWIAQASILAAVTAEESTGV